MAKWLKSFPLRYLLVGRADTSDAADTHEVVVDSSGAMATKVTGRSTTGFETLTVDATVGGKALTSIPANANGAVMTLEGGDIRARTDGGAPTAAVGTLVIYGDSIVIDTRADLLAFKAVRTGATDGSLSVTYKS